MKSLLRKEVVGTCVMTFLAFVVNFVQGQTSTIVMASSSIMSLQISHNATNLYPTPTPSLTNSTSSEQTSTQSISIASSTIMSTPTFSMIVNSSSLSKMDNNSQVPTEKPADADLKNITLYLLIVCVALFLIIIIILIILVVQMKHLTNKLRR